MWRYRVQHVWKVSLPEEGETQRPEDKWPPQVQSGPRPHVAPASKHQGDVQAAEHEGCAPAEQTGVSNTGTCWVLTAVGRVLTYWGRCPFSAE